MSADMDYRAVPLTEYQAGGDSKRENLCQQDSERVTRRTGMGQKGLAARWGLQCYTHVWVCAVTQDQQSE